MKIEKVNGRLYLALNHYISIEEDWLPNLQNITTPTYRIYEG